MYGPSAEGFGEWYVYESVRGTGGEGNEGGMIGVSFGSATGSGDGERDMVKEIVVDALWARRVSIFLFTLYNME